MDRGARIVSLRSGDGREWLAASERTAIPGRGQGFVRPGMGGWDEVAPTVQADPAGGDIAGALVETLPDHGDIWNVPWQVDAATPTSLTASVTLSSLPVTLKRTIAASATGLTFSYRASTMSVEPLPLLWCAHPQFAAGAGATLSLESAGRPIAPELVEMHPAEGRRGGFPTGPAHHGPAQGASLKAFVEPGSSVDAAVLRVAGGRSLRLEWDAAQLPYVGLFWDNGEFAAEPVIAVEPSTAWGERLSAAAAGQRVLTLRRGRPLEWELRVSAG